MVRVISQETFDELVLENMNEFGMDPKDAISDAIAQLEAQGVDLTNIITDMDAFSENGPRVTRVVSELKDLWKSNDKNILEIISQLRALKEEFNEHISRKLKASKDGVYSLLIEMLEYSLNNNLNNLTLEVLKALHGLMDQQPDLLEPKAIALIKRILDSDTEGDIIIATLKWASACCLKHENNRQAIFATNIVNTIKILLTDKKNIKVTPDVLLLMRRLCLDDDIRVEFGKAHDHARELAIYTLDAIVMLLKECRSSPLVSDVLVTLSCVCVRAELCARAAEGGAGEVCRDLLAHNYTDNNLVQQTFKLVTALAGNDDVKRSLMKSGIAPLIVLVINHNMSNPVTVTLGLKCMSVLCLREPTHAQEFGNCGAPDCVCDAMNRYPDHDKLQNSACWAIRNMVARCKEQTSKFLDLGAEALLNKALQKYRKQFGSDVQAALRDLDCEVKFNEQWTGKGIQMSN